MAKTETPVWESYGLFTMVNDEPTTWIETNGDQSVLTRKLKPGQGVFGVEMTIPHPNAGAVMP